MNSIDLKTAKPGIYYRVFNGNITKIDFVRYFERTDHELECDFGSDYPSYEKVTIGCYEYRQHSNFPDHSFGLQQSDCDYREHFFKDLEDAKKYVIEKYYGDEIQKHKKAIEEIEKKLKEFSTKTVEKDIWLL